MLWGQGACKRSKTTDFLIDVQQLSTQLAKAMIAFHLLLGLAQLEGRGEGFGHGFAFDLACQAVVGTMPGVMGLMTVTAGFAAGSAGGGDGAATKIGKVKNLLQDEISLLHQSG